MDELMRELRAATAEAPPSRIDLDRLITTYHRDRRRRGWMTGGAVVAVTLASVLVAPPVLRGLGGGDPSSGRPAPGWPGPVGSPTTPACAPVTPRPSGPTAPMQSDPTVRTLPTEAPAAAVQRLSAELREALKNDVPSGVTVRGVLPGCTAPQFQYERSYREYTAGGRLATATEQGPLHVSVRPTGAGERLDCEQYTLARDRCTTTELPDGGALLVIETPYGVPGVVQRQAVVARTDGTTVTVTTSNAEVGANREPTRGARNPLLTVGQLAALAQAPGLTLYP